MRVCTCVRYGYGFGLLEDLKVPGSNPGRGSCVESLYKDLYSHRLRSHSRKWVLIACGQWGGKAQLVAC